MCNLSQITESQVDNSNQPCLELGKFTIENEMVLFYNHLEAAQKIYQHIFFDKQYDYRTDKESPYIIDCGSNIGVSVLFFKSRYPSAKIMCFEPDLHVFSILNKNIEHNNLTDVTTINAAVTNSEGIIDFFGQLNLNSLDSRGNSIIKLWGSQRKTNGVSKVQAVKLSSYIHSHVDLLKLNIEGSEQQVLEDLDESGKLSLINTVFLEVHDSDSIRHINDVNKIKSILEKNNFSIDIQFKDIKHYLPEEVRSWANTISPSLYYIKAEKSRSAYIGSGY